ncbi:unnamed protein product [Caenorhabditis brenneri]
MCRLPISLYNPGNYEDQLRIKDVTRKCFRFREDFVVVILEVVENDELGGVQRKMLENDEDEKDVDDETVLDDAKGKEWRWIWNDEEDRHGYEVRAAPCQCRIRRRRIRCMGLILDALLLGNVVFMHQENLKLYFAQMTCFLLLLESTAILMVYFWTMKFLLDVQMIERGMTVLEIKYQKIIDEKKDCEYVVNII